MNFTLRTPLFDQAGDGGAGGGAGAGAADNSGAAFDPKAFKAEVIAEVNKAVNGANKSLKTDIGKMLEKITKPAASIEGEGEGSGEGAGSGSGDGAGEGQHTKPGDTTQNTELVRLRKELAQVTKAQKEAIAREAAKDNRIKEQDRVAAIKTAMTGIQFRDEASEKLFFKGVSADIAYDDNGELVANSADGPISVAEYIKDYVTSVPGLLKPVGNGGAGAHGGRPGANGGTVEYQMEDITPAKISAMKPAELAALTKQISDTAAGAFAGKQ